MDPWQVIGIAVVIVCGLVGVIYWSGQSRDDKQDQRAERIEHRIEQVEHQVAEHGKAIARMDERTDTQGKEIHKIREMRHEIIEQCSRSISDFYTDSVKRIAELREWVAGRLK